MTGLYGLNNIKNINVAPLHGTVIDESISDTYPKAINTRDVLVISYIL